MCGRRVVAQVGVLTGGFSSCSTPELPDYYGRMSEVHIALQGSCQAASSGVGAQ